MVPNASPGGRQAEFVVVHENIPITIPSSVEGVKVSYNINVSAVFLNQPGVYKLTGRSTCTTMLEPGATEVLLAGNPMSIPCARDVVVKAASNAATVNFMVVVIDESLALRACCAGSLYKKTFG